MTTREQPGRLDALLADLGAEVLHVPLISTVDADDAGAEVTRALASLRATDWVVVTSPAGAERVAGALADRACRIGVVGTRTAEVVTTLVGRRPDVMPSGQTAADLVAAMPSAVPGERVLLLRADRADPATADRFAARGYEVVAATAYRTVLRSPTHDERSSMLAADAVAFASGSAVTAWVEAVGGDTPPVVAAIGPTTAGVAARSGVKVTTVATDYSIDGLITAIVEALAPDA